MILSYTIFKGMTDIVKTTCLPYDFIQAFSEAKKYSVKKFTAVPPTKLVPAEPCPLFLNYTFVTEAFIEICLCFIVEDIHDIVGPSKSLILFAIMHYMFPD